MYKNPNPFGVFLDMDLTHSTPGLPYALRSLRFDLSLPLWKLYKEPLGTLKEYREIESKETIVHCCRNLYLSLHPFVPWSTSVFFPSFPFARACYHEMEDWGGGGPSGGFSFSSSQTCRQRLYLSCNLWFILIRTIFSYPMMCIWLNIVSIGICQMLLHYWLYMLE